MQKEQLTNEQLKKHFKNNFDLARYAINAAQHFIKAGHEVNVTDLLREIQKHPSHYSPEALLNTEELDENTSDDA